MTLGSSQCAFGAGLHNRWRRNYSEIVASEADSPGGWRPLSETDVRRAIDDVKGSRPLARELIETVAQSFHVRGDGPVRFQVHRRQLGALAVAVIAMSEMRILQLPFSRANTVHLGFVLEGSVTITPRAGAPAVIVPGEVTMITNWTAFDVACSTNTTVLHVLVPEARLRERGVRVRHARFRLEGPRTLAPPLLAFAHTVSEPEWRPTPTANKIAERVLEDLCVGLLIEWEDHDLDREDLRSQLRRRAIEEIASRHRDSTLTPTSLSRILSVSLRHLQRGFEGSGTTVTEQIGRHRTESAALLLSAPGGSALTVSEIARATGFGSTYELRSAFRQRFGLSPSDYRASQAESAPRGAQSHASSAPSETENVIVIS